MPQLAAVKETLNALQGKWRAQYNEVDGRYVGPVANIIELQGNHFKVTQNDQVTYEGTFTVGPFCSKECCETYEIVLIYSKSANPLYLGGPRPGLFQVYGDTLKWSFAAVGHSPPKQLNTCPGSETVLSVYVKDGAKIDAAERRTSAAQSVVLW
jgi:hypothetical protein